MRVSGALVVPSTTPPKVIVDADIDAGATPVPVSATACGLFDASSAMVSDQAGTAPRAVGVRVMPIVQFAPAPNEPGFGQVVEEARA